MSRAPSNLAAMSVDALLKLREDINDVLSRKVDELRSQLSLLTEGEAASRGGAVPKSRRGPNKGRKVAPKYRGPDGSTWAGRGVKPRWLAEALKDGKSADDFLIESTAAGASAKPSGSSFAWRGEPQRSSRGSPSEPLLIPGLQPRPRAPCDGTETDPSPKIGGARECR
jgi:DNA-binding protein H-NS